MNNKLKDFLDAIQVRRQKLDPSKYVPEFDTGDIIVNDKFKVISKVLGIKWREADIRDNTTGRITGYREQIATPHYVLKDFENKAAQEYFSKSGMQLDKKTRQRWKQCVRIDSTYKLLDPAKALILFGERK